MEVEKEIEGQIVFDAEPCGAGFEFKGFKTAPFPMPRLRADMNREERIETSLGKFGEFAASQRNAIGFVKTVRENCDPRNFDGFSHLSQEPGEGDRSQPQTGTNRDSG